MSESRPDSARTGGQPGQVHPGGRRLPVGALGAAGAIDLAALALLVARAPAPPVLAVAALHVAAVLPLIVTRVLSPSEKQLGAAFVLALPVVGAALAGLSLATGGRNELDEPLPEVPLPPELPRVEELRRLGEALPCCEALLAGSAEERRAIIATLTRRGDADAVALLRWALGAADPELAVDAALAIEEMTAGFEAHLRQARAELAATPGPEAALAAAELVTGAIAAGIVDPAIVPKLAPEARGWFAAAAGGDSEQQLAVALGRARLELEVLRPDSALAFLDEALASARPEDRPPLLSLREEAVLASHALPWEGPSALATYQHGGMVPPPLTARRRFGTNRAIPGAGTGGVTVGPVQVPPLSSTTHKVHRDDS